jgi:hypothetical protein
MGFAVARLVEAVHCNPEGGGFILSGLNFSLA